MNSGACIVRALHRSSFWPMLFHVYLRFRALQRKRSTWYSSWKVSGGADVPLTMPSRRSKSSSTSSSSSKSSLQYVLPLAHTSRASPSVPFPSSVFSLSWHGYHLRNANKEPTVGAHTDSRSSWTHRRYDLLTNPPAEPGGMSSEPISLPLTKKRSVAQ